MLIDTQALSTIIIIVIVINQSITSMTRDTFNQLSIVIIIKEVLIGTPWGGGNKNLLAPPPNYFLDDAVLFHCSTAAGSCYPLQMHGK